jgi:hypothetical protein
MHSFDLWREYQVYPIILQPNSVIFDASSQDPVPDALVGSRYGQRGAAPRALVTDLIPVGSDARLEEWTLGLVVGLLVQTPLPKTCGVCARRASGTQRYPRRDSDPLPPIRLIPSRPPQCLTERSRDTPDRRHLGTDPGHPRSEDPRQGLAQHPCKYTFKCQVFTVRKTHDFRATNWAAILQSSTQGRLSAFPFSGKCPSAICRHSRPCERSGHPTRCPPYCLHVTF